MNIYEVIFYGSQTERPNKDTIYLVRAADFQSAVEEVSINASPQYHAGKRFPVAHVVFEIGRDLSLSPESHARILRGPYFESAYNRGWRAWQRQTDGSTYSDTWEEVQ